MAIDDAKRLVADLQAIQKGWRKEVREQIKQAARPIVDDAKASASWSSRIPGAIRVSSRFGRNTTGVAIVVAAARAPHARLYEGLAARGREARSFRHPLFGDREHWYSQAARPFLLPAVRANATEVVEAVGDAIDTLARRHGYTRT